MKSYKELDVEGPVMVQLEGERVLGAEDLPAQIQALPMRRRVVLVCGRPGVEGVPALCIAGHPLACYTLAMALTSIRLPDDLVRDVDEVAARRRSTRSEVVREAVAEYCAAARGGRELDPVALVERLVTYPGSGRGDLAQRSQFYLRALFRARRRRSR